MKESLHYAVAPRDKSWAKERMTMRQDTKTIQFLCVLPLAVMPLAVPWQFHVRFDCNRVLYRLIFVFNVICNLHAGFILFLISLFTRYNVYPVRYHIIALQSSIAIIPTDPNPSLFLSFSFSAPAFLPVSLHTAQFFSPPISITSHIYKMNSSSECNTIIESLYVSSLWTVIAVNINYIYLPHITYSHAF